MSDKKDDTQFADAVAIATRVAVEAFQNGQKATAAPTKAFSIPVGTTCTECGQPGFATEKGLRFACNSEHVKMTVMPQETAHFAGCGLNGVWYRSTTGQPITVPKENDFQDQLNRWDAQEREYQTGRKVTPSQYNPISRPPRAGNTA